MILYKHTTETSATSSDSTALVLRAVRPAAVSYATVPRGLSFVLPLALLFASTRGFAADFRVPGDYQTITAALGAVDTGDIIRVGGGTYSTATGESFPLRLQAAITLEGEPGTRPHLEGDKEHTVVLIESGGVTLRGFRITDGKASEGINNMDGGGICVFVGPGETSPVTVDDCLIENNACPTDETYDGCGGGIYCGGTYCTCFEIHVSDCVIRQNSVHGQGGGMFCALLSNVKVDNTVIEQNTADDHGGGVFVDVYAVISMADTRLASNGCPGDLQKPDWGGKGGGLACESYGVFTVTDCVIEENTARYFGGGFFTRAGRFFGEDLCGIRPEFPRISRSWVGNNRAEVSGGGAYVAGTGVLECSDTVLYHNDAGRDGGAVFVAGGIGIGGELRVVDGCILEGNECARHGGGVYLGPNVLGRFESMRFLGNASLLDGGALFVDTAAAGSLADCRITYNNSARGYGGGLRGMPQSYVYLEHCSVIGNFAPHGRSGLYLDAEATVSIRDSILHRNAGGAVDADGATVDITRSLNEDGADPDRAVLCCNPGYVGWGNHEAVYVVASASSPGDGTLEHPYRDLQTALDGFDLCLGADSPCIGMASDGGNLGADTGVGGESGIVTAELHLAPGTYDIRGRNIIFIQGVQGAGSAESSITNAVFGCIEDATIRDLTIKGEEIFGGIVLRADIEFEGCGVSENAVLVDGGGIYVAEGLCSLTETSVSENVCYDGHGGGIYLSTGTGVALSSSSVEQNAATTSRGGGIYASLDTAVLLVGSVVSSNRSATYGGGLCLEDSTTSYVRDDSEISLNIAHQGAGIHVSGLLEVSDANVTENRAEVGGGRQRTGGGIYANSMANVRIEGSRIASNHAAWAGGGVMCWGNVDIGHSMFEANTSRYGGGISIGSPGRLDCQGGVFRANRATVRGGAADIGGVNTAPWFVECAFEQNNANTGGACACLDRTYAKFVQCDFKNNVGLASHGGCFLLQESGTQFNTCSFSGSSAKQDGGVAYLTGSDASLFEDCRATDSTCGRNGGTLCITGSAQPVLSRVQILRSSATDHGGGIAIFESARPRFTDLSVAVAQGKYGGGVYAAGQSESTFLQCEFRSNKAYELTLPGDGGGAYFTEHARGWFTRCAFRGNMAQDDGGGMGVAEHATVDLRNTLFAANAAVDDGGGIHFTHLAAGMLTNCTLTQNNALLGGTGGGIYLETGNILGMDCSIIWQNSPDGIRGEATPTVSHSCTQKDWPGRTNFVTDPQLEPDIYCLQEGSPCIDAGDPDPEMSDACLGLCRGMGGLRNDMGFTGGPDNCTVYSQSAFNFASFSDSDSLMLCGNATVTNGVLRLTEAQAWQVGGAWYALPVDVRGGFETIFDFRIDRDTSDGIAFVIQNAGLSALGRNGGYIGYDIPNSIAIEFDTWRNGGFGDPNPNHLSIQTRGIEQNSPNHSFSLGSTASIPFLSDNRTHTARITYLSGQLSVYVDDMQRAALVVPADLENILSLTDGRAFVGLTAATGSLMEIHDILSWSYISAGASADTTN